VGSSALSVEQRGWADRLKRPALIVLACYWAALVIGTHIPQPEVIVPENVSDKFLHLVAYGGLSALMLVNALLRVELRWFHWLAVLLAIGGWAMLDEVTQIPFGRHFDLLDWTADVLGAAAAAAGVAIMAWIWRSRSRIAAR
jgi:VanZ family protein